MDVALVSKIGAAGLLATKSAVSSLSALGLKAAPYVSAIAKAGPATATPSAGTVVIIGVGVGTFIVAPYAAVPLLGAVGFKTGGIVAGSKAASMMSAAALANGGGVASGSLVALLQSAGAAGIGTGTSAVCGMVGSGLSAISQLRIKSKY